ncbi:regulatory protein RecX [Thermus thermamylovorans]|uniref:Regulatory protein RecX n=1 Tax=Thermus thermamylovorans TaxID=2509362 RepID=A0A4Q9B3X6_9DEIN|nr:regulatory protein RecX [Thermus thermamylovorans]TBH20098.1 regulatory protein RecX [Thermus thermamylovorans]
MGNSEALAYAVRLLAQRALSRARLREKLLARFPRGEVEAALARLEELGYLDDRAFAEAFVASRRKYGPLKLRHLLLAQGVPGEVVEEVLAAHEGESLEAALKVLRRYPRRLDQARAVRFLQGRGFSLGVALEAYRLVKEEERG